jgi:hypothetical protein
VLYTVIGTKMLTVPDQYMAGTAHPRYGSFCQFYLGFIVRDVYKINDAPALVTPRCLYSVHYGLRPTTMFNLKNSYHCCLTFSALVQAGPEPGAAAVGSVFVRKKF